MATFTYQQLQDSLHSGIASGKQAALAVPKSAPTKQTASPGYLTSISSVKELKNALNVGSLNHAQFLQRFAQLTNAPTKPTLAMKLNDIKNATASSAAGIAQAVPRSAAELALSLQPKNTAKAPPVSRSGPTMNIKSLPAPARPIQIKPTTATINPSNKLTEALFGKTGITPIQAQAKGAETSHPQGFHIKGTPITLSPKQTGAAEGALKTAVDIATVAGAAKGAAKTVSRVASKVEKIKSAESIKKPTITPPKVQKPTVAQSNEAGFAAPGQAVSDVKSLVDKHQATTNYGKDLQHAASASEGNKQIILKDATDVLKGREKLSNTDKQTLQDYRDAKAAGLKPKPLPAHLKAEDAQVTELNKAAQAHDAELARLNGQEQKAQKILSRDPSTYTHRVAQNKGGAFDYLLQGDRKSPLSVSRFGKSKPGDKARVYHSVTDEQGNRQVVSIKSGDVTALGEKSTSLGKLKLQTNEDLLKNELSPFQTKVNNLQKEYDTLSKVKTKGGISQSRFDNLAKKAALLEDARNFSGLTKSEAKSLRDATLKLQELSKVKGPKTNVEGRLNTLNRHLTQLNNKVSEIHNKYNPEELNNKVFVGKDGKNYTVGQATQSEITKTTGQKYYTDPKLNALTNYVESRTGLENARFIESIKTDPRFKDFVSPPDVTAPKGWKTIQGFDQFRGYRFEPKTAETIKDILNNSSSEKDALDKVGRFIRQTIVYFPVKHDLNMAAAYAVDRGLTSLANPLATKRAVSSLYKAMHEVLNQGPLFQRLQKEGFSLPSADNSAFERAFKGELGGLIENKTALNQVAKQIGSTPSRIKDTYDKIQHVTVWELQDILNTARVIERMSSGPLKKGMSLEDAVKQTERFNFQYKVPSRVAGSRSVSRALQSDKVFFGRYRYDQWKILSNVLKDSVNIKHPVQAAQSWDKLAVLALGATLLWPIVNKGVQKLSGDPNAYITAPGPLDIPEKLVDIYKGKRDASSVASNQIYLGPLQTALDVKNNTDSFTGKKIHDTNSSGVDQLKQTGDFLKNQLAPVQKGTSLKNTTTNKAVNVGLGLAGATFPKNSPLVNKLNSLAFDTQPNIQTKAKTQAKAGDIQGAKQTINQYNQKVLQTAIAALKDEGRPVPEQSKLVKELTKARIYYNPKDKTIRGWQTTKSSPILDKLHNDAPSLTTIKDLRNVKSDKGPGAFSVNGVVYDNPKQTPISKLQGPLFSHNWSPALYKAMQRSQTKLPLLKPINKR